jgi:hypothetical protein
MSCEKVLFNTFGVCNAPVVTQAHRLMGIATILGAFFVPTHIVTILVTTFGPGWGESNYALIADLSGFFSGAVFVIICRKSSNQRSSDFREWNKYIAIWAAVSVGVRIFDTLMLFGIVKFSKIYKTPESAVLWSNVVSELFFGFPYAVLALTASVRMLREGSFSGELEKSLVSAFDPNTSIGADGPDGEEGDEEESSIYVQIK